MRNTRPTACVDLKETSDSDFKKAVLAGMQGHDGDGEAVEKMKRSPIEKEDKAVDDVNGQMAPVGKCPTCGHER